MSRSLKNQIVLITGASSGFGADAARLFARQGCLVVLAARRLDRLTELAVEVQKAGGRAFPLALDVADQASIEAGLRTVLDQFGRVDVLFNNAGFGRLQWLETLDPAADIDTQIDVNLRGVIQMTRAVLPSMLARRSGTIINMSSVAGRIAAPLYTIYAATKFGVRGFTDALRRETAPLGVRVCGIYPGAAATEFGQHTGTSEAKKRLKTPGFMKMTSAYVARKVVSLAKRPRRAVTVPWWMLPVIWFEALFPGLVDWFLKAAVVKRMHTPDSDEKE